MRGRPPVPAPRTGRPLRRRQETAAGISTQPRSARSGQPPPDGADHDQSKSTRQQGVLKQSHASAGLAAEGSSGHALQAVGRWEPSQRSADGRNDSRFFFCSAARHAVSQRYYEAAGGRPAGERRRRRRRRRGDNECTHTPPAKSRHNRDGGNHTRRMREPGRTRTRGWPISATPAGDGPCEGRK